MFFLNALDRLKASKVFKDWKKDNKDAFLSIGFLVIENSKQKPWMIGFYTSASDTISSFLVDETACHFEKNDEVFKKPGTQVLELDTAKIKLDLEDALKTIDTCIKNNYSHETILKTILIIQNLENFGTIWNITLVTHAFNAINIKINALNGKVLEHKLSSLISYTAG